MGDWRLSARLVKSAGLLAAYPGHKINASPDSDSTATNSFYRLIEKLAESAVSVENFLAPHREGTTCRIRSQRSVLAIQDGTDLNSATWPGCDGLEVIGRIRTSAKSLGLRLHATLAVTGNGLPLGVLRLGFDGAVKRTPKAEKWKKTERPLAAFVGIGAAVREVCGKERVPRASHLVRFKRLGWTDATVGQGEDNGFW